MSKINVISEENYAEIMLEKVEPALENARECGYFDSYSGGKIFYNYYKCENARAGIVICHGFTECSEKFNEMAYYYLQNGYNVFSLDHRGHGKSLRENDDFETVAIHYFDDYVKDLRRFMALIVGPTNGNLPCYLYAHSMGGAIAVRYLQEYRCDGFDKCVLTAPMISCNTNGLPHFVAGTLCGILSFFGQGKKAVPGLSGFDENKDWTKSNATSKARFDYWHAKRKKNPEYQTSRASSKWIVEALKIIPLMTAKHNCTKISIPVLLCQAEEDGSVIPEMHNVFIDKVNGGKIVKFDGSRHEIYLSPTNVVQKYIDTIFDFLDEE